MSLLKDGQIKNSVIGIGLNVNQDSFPPHLKNVTSVKQILHADYDLRNLLSEICSHIEAWYLNLRAGKVSFVRNEYLKRLYWLNESRGFKTQNGIFNGVIKDVKDNGLLIVQNNIGEELEFSLKEIEFLNK